MTEPVAGRQCGECNVCCHVLAVEALRKVPGETCRHLDPGTGCTIYASRPESCRTWYCGWRMLPLGEEWRPDRSEILVIALSGAETLRLEAGLEFELVGARDRLHWMPLVNMIASLIERGGGVHLSVRSEPGCASNGVYLNTNASLRNAIAGRDLAAVKAQLSEALNACLAHPQQKVEYGGDANTESGT